MSLGANFLVPMAGVCPRLKNSPPDCFSPDCGRVAFSPPSHRNSKTKTSAAEYTAKVFLLVPMAGVEPARYRYQRILSDVTHPETTTIKRNLKEQKILKILIYHQKFIV